MKIVCRDCGEVLIDTENNVNNYRVYFETEIGGDLSKGLVVEKFRDYIMCMNCGRKIERETIDRLGVKVKWIEWKRGDQYE
jgi:hypothetical protein